jgi:PAS domain S-box-containing protein
MPARVAAVVLLVVFMSELAVMTALHFLTVNVGLPWWAQSLLDAVALTVVVSLFVLFALIGPLQAALRAEREKIRVVLDSASEGIVTIDGRGLIQTFNGAAEKLFGYSAAEIVGRNVSLIVPSPDKERHDGYLKRYLRTGEGRVVNKTRQVQAQRRDGSLLSVEMSMSEV